MKLRWKTNRKTDSTLPEITVPDAWNKLTRKQLLFVASLFNRTLELYTFKVIALNKLAGIKITGEYYVDETDRYLFEIKNKTKKYFVSAGLYKQLLAAVSFITSGSSLTKQLIPRFSLSSMPFALCPLPFFYGPDDCLYNVVYNEFIHAQLACANFENTKDKNHLNTLTAVLYRRKNQRMQKSDPHWNGDLREDFSAYTYNRRASWFRLLPFKLKYAIYIYYRGSVDYMVAQHPLCFKPSTKISTTPKVESPVQSLIDFIPILNQGDPTRNPQILTTPIWDIFDTYETILNQSMQSK